MSRPWSHLASAEVLWARWPSDPLSSWRESAFYHSSLLLCVIISNETCLRNPYANNNLTQISLLTAVSCYFKRFSSLDCVQNNVFKSKAFTIVVIFKAAFKSREKSSLSIVRCSTYKDVFFLIYDVSGVVQMGSRWCRDLTCCMYVDLLEWIMERHLHLCRFCVFGMDIVHSILHTEYAYYFLKKHINHVTLWCCMVQLSRHAVLLKINKIF